MSIDVYISAVKKLTESDQRLVSIINACLQEGLAIPLETLQRLKARVGSRWVDKALERGSLPEEELIELDLYHHPAMTDGIGALGIAVIDLSKLPEGTVALRIDKL